VAALVGWGAFSAAQHWNELTQDIGNRVLAPENLLVLGLVFPLLKAAHEFGHACAVKAWGGEVHEMGVMFLVMMPVPYVDASAASAFAQRRQRVIVGAAGMAVELCIASAALLFWLDMQPGLPRAVLFNVMLIAGVSTVLFNANPLLRFDGYYILSDLIDIPNLRQRAQQYLGAVLQRGLFGIANDAVQATPREAAWFLFFSIASFIYRLTVTSPSRCSSARITSWSACCWRSGRWPPASSRPCSGWSASSRSAHGCGAIARAPY
jgi:putative peptide zinc metalloprotease protein